MNRRMGSVIEGKFGMNFVCAWKGVQLNQRSWGEAEEEKEKLVS